jgi:uncharacterized protein (DUF433 family)
MAESKNTIVSALTVDQVSRVTGLTPGQLFAWDRKGFFSPRFAYDDRTVAYSRIYSFKDVVGLKTIQTLRKEYKIGFKKLKEVAKELVRRGYEHWADTKLYVVKKEVYFRDPYKGRVEGLSTGQYAMLAVIEVIEDVNRGVLQLKRRDNDTEGKIEKQKYITRNSSVVSGTRIPTATIRRYHEAGFSIKEIIEEYPALSEQDIFAALEYEGRKVDKSA